MLVLNDKDLFEQLQQRAVVLKSWDIYCLALDKEWKNSRDPLVPLI